MADLGAFNDYERDFLSLTTPLPGRVTSLTNYTDPEQATSEIRRLDSDLTQAKQRVCSLRVRAHVRLAVRWGCFGSVGSAAPRAPVFSHGGGTQRMN